MSSSSMIIVSAVLLSASLSMPYAISGERGAVEFVNKTRITGMDTLHYQSPSASIGRAIPEDISRLLDAVMRDHLEMPAAAIKIISSMRYARHEGLDIYGHRLKPDVWIRRFPASNGSRDGIAVSIRLGCDGLQNQHIVLSDAGVQDLPASVLPSCDWLTRFPTGRLETGLMLFLANADGTLEPVHEVPGTFFPLITETMMAQLQQRGVGRPFISPGGYSRNRHMRVVMEEDPDRPLPSDTPGYDDEGTVYGGVLAWTGSGFEIQQEDPPVPAAD